MVRHHLKKTEENFEYLAMRVGRYSQTFLQWTTAIPEKSARYNGCLLYNCQLYRGFAMRIWPGFGQFLENLSAIDVEIIVPLKHLSDFWRILEVPPISCKFNLLLTWSADHSIGKKLFSEYYAELLIVIIRLKFWKGL